MVLEQTDDQTEEGDEDMTLEELKKKVEAKDISDLNLIIFKDKEGFISSQYIRAVAEILNKEIVYYDELKPLLQSFSNPWVKNNSVNVLKTAQVNLKDVNIKNIINTFIICEKCDSPAIECPPLVDWQIKEFIRLKTSADPDMLYRLCGGNIWRIQNELDKLKEAPNPQISLQKMVEEGQFMDIEEGVIWDYIDALFKKDFAKCRQMIPKIMSGACDVTDFFLATSLYNKLVRLIKVKLEPNPTPEKTGLSEKQIWAIRKFEASQFTPDQLMELFEKVSALDSRVKTGEFPTEFMVDYLTTLFLSR